MDFFSGCNCVLTPINEIFLDLPIIIKVTTSQWGDNNLLFVSQQGNPFELGEEPYRCSTSPFDLGCHIDEVGPVLI